MSMEIKHRITNKVLLVVESANLLGASLYGANLQGADLYGANLCDANLRGANLRGANLQSAGLPAYSICPEEGSFIAFKKLANGVIAKIRIPSDAKRTSTLIGRKCRASKIEILEFLNSEEREVAGWRHNTFKYSKGKEIFPDKYDDDIRVECTHGIHFFMTKKEAEQW